MVQRNAPGQSLPELHQRRTAASTAAFLARHLKPGMSLLDCGCGPGTITLGLAELVAPGQVTGVDLDPIRVREAAAAAASAGVTNATFEVGDMYNLSLPDESFDAVFENNVLMHLSEPERAVVEVLRVLRPGGVFGARDANANGHLILNALQEMDESLPVVLAWQRSRGMDIFAGARVGSLLRDAGFAEVEDSASYDSFATRDAVRTIADQMAHRIETVVADYADEHGLADRAKLNRMAAAFREWSTHRDAFWAAAHGEAVGWKPETR